MAGYGTNWLGDEKPAIRRLELSIAEKDEVLWLYQVEDAVLMVEVLPEAKDDTAFGQVVLKRLIDRRAGDRTTLPVPVSNIAYSSGTSSTSSTSARLLTAAFQSGQGTVIVQHGGNQVALGFG